MWKQCSLNTHPRRVETNYEFISFTVTFNKNLFNLNNDTFMWKKEF